MKNNSMYTLDMIQAWVFGVLALVAAYGVIAKGAWWHIGTMVICVALVLALRADAKKELQASNSEKGGQS